MRVGLQVPLHMESVSDDGSEAEEQDRRDIQAAVRETLERVRQCMERDGRFLYGGQWRTPEEIRALRWQARKDDLAQVRDMVLVLLVSVGIVAFAYQFLLLLFP